MVGFCGVLGDIEHDLGDVAATIKWSDDEASSRFVDEDFELYHSTHHDDEASAQPAKLNSTEQKLWIWGDCIGHEESGTYRAREDHEQSDAAYCADLLEEYGLSFVDGLNSEFAGVVLDRSQNEVTLFTDRLGARPIYYTESIEGCLLFSTHPNTILAYEEFDPRFDDDFLLEFFTFERAFGIYTPYEGIIQLHPGSKLTYDLENRTHEISTYWMPEYDPVQKPYDQLVDEFLNIIKRAVAERRVHEGREGLQLSGGSDSRLLLSVLDDSVTCYHLNEVQNNEAKTARRACEVVDAPFRFLKRGMDYQASVLEQVGEFQLLSSFFDIAHFVGYEDVFVDEIDSMITGHTADTMLDGFYLPMKYATIPVLGWTIPLPLVKNIKHIDEYIDHILTDHSFCRNPCPGTPPSFLSFQRQPQEILKEHILMTNGSIIHHGVRYPSLESLAHAGGFYPLTNNKAFLNYYTVNQMLPTRYPFLDNRVIDFSLSYPHRYLARRSLVNDALAKKDPELASIPHAGTGLPLTRPATLHSVSDLSQQFVKKFRQSSEDHVGPWTDHNYVLRQTDMMERYFFDRDSDGFCTDFLDRSAVEKLYERHDAGEDNFFELYAVLSLCNSYPVKNNFI